MTNLTVAIIGAGNMGSAIARGLAKSTLLNTKNIRISDVSEQNLELLQSSFPTMTVSKSNTDIVKGADILILAVKPWLIKSIAKEIEEQIDYNKQLIVSIAAGVNFSELIELFGVKANLFRIIPNTAIDVSQGVSSIAAHNTSEEQNRLILSLFAELGETFFVAESQLNAFMSLSSCGIAYAFRYIRAATEGGVEIGINPETSKKVILQTLKGAIELLEANNSHPEAEIDKVTTPGGTTIKGLNEMEANGFSNAVIKGLKASHIKIKK